MRRFLDRLYAASGALAALCLAGIAVAMLAQAAMRELGMLFRGADDIVAWLCAASAFFALGYTFRHGELVRVGLLIEHLPGPARRLAETLTLAAAALFTAYVAWAAARFVFASWKYNEVAQGLIQIPIWIPQMSFVVGAAVFLIAVIDELAAHLSGRKTAYQSAEDARRAQSDFSDHV